MSTTPELPVKEIAKKYPKGGVEEAAFFAILNSISEAPHVWGIIPHFVNGAKFGANWQKEHSIDRDKFVEIIQANIIFIETKITKHCATDNMVISGAVSALNDLLNQIKDL